MHLHRGFLRHFVPHKVTKKVVMQDLIRSKEKLAGKNIYDVFIIYILDTLKLNCS